MFSRGEFASESLAQHHALPCDDGSDPWRDFPLLALALPCEPDGTLHERTFPMWRGIVDGHGPMVLAIRGRE
jgi:hypothetical protein